MSGYICRYCRLPSDASGISCPNCGAPVNVARAGQRLGMGGAAAHRRHGPDPVRPARPARSRARTSRWPTWAWPASDWVYFSHHVLLWTEPSVDLAPCRWPAGWNRMYSRHAADHDAGRRPRPHRLQPRPSGRDGRHPAPARPGGRRPRAPLPGGDRQRDLRRGSRPASTSSPAAATTARPTTRSGSTSTASGPRAGPGCCCSTRRATPSSATSSRARPSASSPAPCCTRTRRSGCSSTSSTRPATWARRNYQARTAWLRMWGPGRVAVQSVFERPESAAAITGHSPASTQRWG